MVFMFKNQVTKSGRAFLAHVLFLMTLSELPRRCALRLQCTDLDRGRERQRQSVNDLTALSFQHVTPFCVSFDVLIDPRSKSV